MHTPPDVIHDDPRIAALLRIDPATPLPAAGWLRQTGRAMLHSGVYAPVWRYGTEVIEPDGCVIHQFGGWRVG